MKKVILSLVVLLLSFSVSVQPAQAACIPIPGITVCPNFGGGSGSGGTEGLKNPATGTLGTNESGVAERGVTFITYFISIWRALITVGGLLVIVYFLWGALEWISAGGDSGKIQKARDKMMQAVMGLVLLVGSFVIIGLISNLFFGEAFQILNPTLPVPTELGSSS